MTRAGARRRGRGADASPGLSRRGRDVHAPAHGRSEGAPPGDDGGVRHPLRLHERLPPRRAVGTAGHPPELGVLRLLPALEPRRELRRHRDRARGALPGDAADRGPRRRRDLPDGPRPDERLDRVVHGRGHGNGRVPADPGRRSLRQLPLRRGLPSRARGRATGHAGRLRPSRQPPRHVRREPGVGSRLPRLDGPPRLGASGPRSRRHAARRPDRASRAGRRGTTSGRAA